MAPDDAAPVERVGDVGAQIAHRLLDLLPRPLDTGPDLQTLPPSDSIGVDFSGYGLALFEFIADPPGPVVKQ